MSEPLVSIIIPVYKVEKYISRCLDSILNQTFQDFEIILVNDSSPDDSIRIAEEYAQRDTRIRILHNEENSGAGWSRMVGYTNAKGEYITFCDSDDYLFFQVLQYCEKVINVNEVVYYYFDNNESASYNKSNPNAMNAMLTSLNYIEDIYKEIEGFKNVIHKWKLDKYAKFISISGNNKELLEIIFKNNIDYLFTPWNLLKYTHKSRALRILIMYLKAKIKITF